MTIIIHHVLFTFTFTYRFDYGEKFWVIKHKYFTCHCGSEKCRYSKSKITNFLQEYYKRNGEPVPEPAQQLAKLASKASSNNSNGDVVNTDDTTKSKSSQNQNQNHQNGNSENNKKSSEDNSENNQKNNSVINQKNSVNNQKKVIKKESTSSKSSSKADQLSPNCNVVIPLTKVNVKNLNDSFNASKLEKLMISPDRKKEATETSSTNSTPASTRPRRSVTLKKTEAEDKK